MCRANIAAAGVLSLMLAASPLLADDGRVDHFEGESAETLEEAMHTLAVANAELEELQAGKLTDADMARIHGLSYTLENALERISQEVEATAVILEHIHIASERMDRDTVRTRTPEYLERTRALQE